MPIRPENKHRYPIGADWRRIRTRILERAHHCCEGIPVFPDCRAANGQPHPLTGSIVVLTIAHLNHTPEDNQDENLKALCQKCHNTYDAAHRYATRQAQRIAKEQLPLL